MVAKSIRPLLRSNPQLIWSLLRHRGQFAFRDQFPLPCHSLGEGGTAMLKIFCRRIGELLRHTFGGDCESALCVVIGARIV